MLVFELLLIFYKIIYLYKFVYYTKSYDKAISAIWIALVAAPFLILSATTQRFTPLSTLKSLLILPTNTSSLSSNSTAVGYSFLAGLSTTTTPGASSSVFTKSSNSNGLLNSTFIDSLWPFFTGTLTVVAVILNRSYQVFS